jgi:hypothetical protein
VANGRKTFRLDILGEGVLPETTRASDLADLMADFEKAILDTAAAQGVELSDDPFVSLVSIESGSNRLKWVVTSAVLQAATTVWGAVASHDFRTLPRPAHQALHNICKKATVRRWSVKFVSDDPSLPAGEISADDPVPPPPPAPEVRGTTTLFGRCIRVGGVKPRAEISLPRGGTIFIDVSESLARKLAQRLYDQVCLDGEASWDPEDWSIQSFKATAMADYTPSSLASAFADLAARAAGTFDGLDVEEFVRQRRYGGAAE